MVEAKRCYCINARCKGSGGRTAFETVKSLDKVAWSDLDGNLLGVCLGVLVSGGPS